MPLGLGTHVDDFSSYKFFFKINQFLGYSDKEFQDDLNDIDRMQKERDEKWAEVMCPKT